MRQSPNHATCRIEVRVGSRNHSRQNDEVKEVSGVWNTDTFKNGDKGALQNGGFVKRQQSGQNDDRPNEEDHQANNGRTHGQRNHLFGVLRFTSGYPNQLGTRECKVHGNHRGENR